MSKPATRIVALYKFSALPDAQDHQFPLKDLCVESGVAGTLILASEGINGTIGGPSQGVERVLDYIRDLPGMDDIELKESWADEMPFFRMKVHHKPEIVTMGVPEADPLERVGAYVEPEDWNALISEPGVVIVDTRNHYESRIGTFEGSTLPDTESFRDFPEWVEEHAEELRSAKKIAMFCTGGIRCERATAHMLNQGFEEVYHLHGGILKYLETIESDASKWEGDCFVFDQRVSVGHGLVEGDWDICYACREPINAEHKASDGFELGVSCPLCVDTTTSEQKQGYRERHKQQQLARARDEQHIGANPRTRQ